MTDERARAEVTARIMDMYIQSIGWHGQDELSLDANLSTDLKTDSDDLSFFAEEVETAFGMRLTQREWAGVNTLREMIELVLQYRGIKLPVEEGAEGEEGFLGRLWQRLSR